MILADYAGGAVETGLPVIVGVAALPLFAAIALLGVPLLGGGVVVVWILLGVGVVTCLVAPSTAVATVTALLDRGTASNQLNDPDD
ncbi:MAG: hypothetical protein A07HR60_00618 [uncultured archaeon A07HR60]|nr:MAG: hypothetical protein A07HR60_00618 [uncultured archaeon A07HR60]